MTDRITVTAKWVSNPRQGWAGWIAWIKAPDSPAHFMGGAHASFCDAIETSARVIRSASPGSRVACIDPTPAQKRKAEALLSGWDVLRMQSDARALRP